MIARPEALEVLAANSFPVERRAYYLDMAADADLERAWLALEEEADRAQRRVLGDELAIGLGVPTLGRVVEVLLLSERLDLRERAAALIGRAVTRQAAEAA